MEFTERQLKLLDQHRCFKCEKKLSKSKIMGPFGMIDSYKCKRCNPWFVNVAKDPFQIMQGIEHLTADTVMELC